MKREIFGTREEAEDAVKERGLTASIKPQYNFFFMKYLWAVEIEEEEKEDDS